MVSVMKYMGCGTFFFGVYFKKHINSTVVKIQLSSPRSLSRHVTAFHDAKKDTKVVSLS